VRVPLPVRPRTDAYGNVSEEEIRASIRSADKRHVPLALLRALQHTVSSSRVAQYELEPDTHSEGGSPIVVERGGKLYLRNGHHRATAAIRRGDRTLYARVAHLGPSEPRRFREQGHAGELLLIDPSAMSATYRQHDVEDVAEVVGRVAVVCIEGPLESKCGSSWWGYFDDYESILCRFENAIRSDDVDAVLLKIDSGGGAAAGLNECVDAMIRCKREVQKPVYAYVDEAAYSAAYALACAADEIYLPRAGGVGSIGVIVQLCDVTERNKQDGIRYEVVTSGARKADYNVNVPISNAAIARTQARVDGLADIYFRLVKQARRIDAKALEANTFYGRDAVRRGLADGVLTLEATMSAISDRLDNGTTRGATSANGTSRRSGTPQSRDAMSRILALTADVQRATKAVAEAKTKDKPTYVAALAIAESRLARELAKITKDKKTVTNIHESESESSSSSSSSSGSSESESASASESESASARLDKDEQEILALVRQMTGKVSAREVLGALEAMRETIPVAERSAKQLAKLTAERETRKVEDLIAAGKASFKITPGNEPKARKIAAKYGHRALGAFIDAAMPAVDGRETQEAQEVDGVTITEEQRKIWTKLGEKEENWPKLARAVQQEQERIAKGQPPKRGGL
jgi:ClpP class serine protease